MKRIVMALFFLAITISNSEANPFKDHPVFSRLTGKWEAEGEFNAADGTVIKITEKWSGKIDDDGAFVVTGERLFNEEQQEFSWRFIYNVTTELFECEYTQSTMEEPIRLDTTVTNTDRKISMRAQIGDGGAELTIVKTLSEDGKSMESEVQMAANGQVGLSGKITHKPTTEAE
ncbi:MAG: hypothetical protein HKN23_05990 [Verrucomicrobiales bacterium]|nr:hypothetical protein [Verrucomicrobiales bacterium]